MPLATAPAGEAAARSEEPRRVAVFRAELLPASETFVLSHARALHRWSAQLAGYARSANSLDLTSMPFTLVPRPQPGSLLSLLRRFAGRGDPPLAPTLASMGVELVHCHFGTDATDVWPSVRHAGLPMLVTLHGYDATIRADWWEAGHGGARRRSYPMALRRMAQDPRVRFHAVSEHIADSAGRLGIARDRVSVAHLGVDTSLFRPSGSAIHARASRVLFVGRMVEKKAPLDLIRAFARVKRTLPAAELVMVGDGPLLPRARALAAESNLGVAFAGTLDPPRILRLLSEVRAFCLPSIVAANGDSEGLPVSVMEAMACGVPVVTSAKGAVPEAVGDDEFGLSFPPGDTEALASALLRILQDDALASRISIAGRAQALRTFDVSRNALTLERLYDDTCS